MCDAGRCGPTPASPFASSKAVRRAERMPERGWGWRRKLGGQAAGTGPGLDLSTAVCVCECVCVRAGQNGRVQRWAPPADLDSDFKLEVSPTSPQFSQNHSPPSHTPLCTDRPRSNCGRLSLTPPCIASLARSSRRLSALAPAPTRPGSPCGQH